MDVVLTRVRAHANIETFFLLAAAALMVYLPHAEGSASWVTYNGLTSAAALVAWLGVLRAPPSRRMPAALLAIGITSSALGDNVYALFNWTEESGAAVSAADIFWIGSYVALAAGVLCLIVSDDDRRRWDIDALIDLFVMLVVSFTVIWVASLESLLSDGSTPVFHRLVWAAYPVLDATLVVLVVRLVVGRRLVSWASMALALGLGLWLLSDFVYLVDSEATYWWLDTGWVAGAALMGYAVARFGAERQVVRADRPPAEAMTPRRILLGILPILLPFSLEIVGHSRGDETNPLPLYAATAVLALLACVRTIRLARRAAMATRHVAAQERHYRALVANSADAVVVVDRRGTVMSSSGNLEGLVGSRAADAVGVDVRQVLRPLNDSDAEATFLGATVTPGVVFMMELQVRHADGAPRWLSARAVSLLEDPAVRGVVVNLHDITDQKQVEDELAHQAFHDSLTGLANRALFADRAEQALRRAARTAEDPAVLYLDLDGFKKINDSLGHLVGDAVLNEIAARLAGSVRDGDTVGRLGGDEFAILIEGADTTNGIALATAERILKAMRPPLEAGGHQVLLSASVGVCVAEAGTSVTDLLRNADLAMYRAKARGKDQWILYEPEMSVDALKRLQLEADLIRAVERDELTLVYQPVVDLASETVVGFEALIRWQHPTLGLISPDQFIPVAEDNGMILPIGRWVHRDGLRHRRPLGAGEGTGVAHRGERVGSAAQQRADRGRRGQGARDDRPAPVGADPRDHRDLARPRTRHRRGPAGRAPRAGRPLGDRRLRHGVLVAELPPAVPRRHPQDRPLLHRHDQRGRAHPAPRAGPAVARAHPRRGDRGRGHRAPGPARAAPGAALRLRSGLPLRAAAR